MPSEARIPGHSYASWSSWVLELLASYFPGMRKVEVLGPWRCIEIKPNTGQTSGVFGVCFTYPISLPLQ